MKVKIIGVGRIKEKYLIDGINEYKKRLGAYAKVEIIEVPDEKIPDKASNAEEEIVKEKEGKKILEKIKDDEFVVLLDVQGKQIDSVELSQYIEKLMVDGKSTIDFVIGGSLGHCPSIYQRANFKLSFSKMTFPHQLMRLFLVEQVYRSFKIMRKETYHK